MTPNFSKLPRNMIIYFDSENLEKNHKNPCIDFWDCAYVVESIGVINTIHCLVFLVCGQSTV